MGNQTSEEKAKTQKPEYSDDPDCIYRVFNVFAYFIVLVIIGVPIWWYTTRVYRADLPLERMFDAPTTNAPKDFGILLSLDYDVLITIVHPDVQNLKVHLDGEDLESHLRPFLDEISPIADFVVKSQWLYLVELGAIPRKIIDHYVLSEEQLPHVITPLEKKLWSHLSPRPCLNLVLYVSHCSVPLYIESNETKSNAFLSPRWGGISILNPDKESCTSKEFTPNLNEITSIFVTQLSHLLKMNGIKPSDVLELQKRKTIEMIDSTRRTLKSIAQLLSEISNIVISDDVAHAIEIAVDSADKADSYLKQGNIRKAIDFAKIAYKNSEDAFSDPSLLALLYFPDDQKYAVYIPLFLPMMIPVFMSLFTLKKWFREKKIKFE